MKIISGGQTGADQAGLRAAKQLGMPTGGYAPHGWKTDEGPAPWLADYGLIEHPSSQYAPRTIANVRLADATIWFGDDTSPGGRLTLRTLKDDERQFIRISLATKGPLTVLRVFLALVHPDVLNIAGNRERTNPGIGAFVEQLLIEALRAT